MDAKFVRMLRIVWPCLACLWLASSRLDFAEGPKPQAKTPDIQGTWNLVSCERNGNNQKLQKSVRIFLTEDWIYAEGMSLPDDKGVEYCRYELSPGNKPGVALLNLSLYQGRKMVPGICTLDKTTLRIALGRVTKTRALPLKDVPVDRPKEFATIPGSDQVLLVLKRPAAADDPLVLLRKLGGNPTPTLGYVNLGHKQAKQTRDEDLAVIKKYPLISALTLRGCQITDAGLVHLKDMANLEYLTLADMPITNAGLVHLEGLPKLIELQVSCAKVTGEGIKRFTRLKSLHVPDSAFSDADLVHLKGLTRLECLNLSNTAITDAGLIHLKPLVNLDRLFLEKTRVTDAGLEHLQGLTRLRHLRLRGTKVTREGIRALRAAIPRIEELER
jgi:uncharacterized protein (TIGR03067 family)